MIKIMAKILADFGWLFIPLAQRGEPPAWGPGMMGNWGYGMMGWFGPIMMLVFGGLIILVLVFLARWLWGSARNRPEEGRPDSPMDLLKRRYASGEIDREEFEQKKRDLSQP